MVSTQKMLANITTTTTISTTISRSTIIITTTIISLSQWGYMQITSDILRYSGKEDKLLFLFNPSDSLQPNGLQHARLPCPSPPPGGLLKLMSIELVIIQGILLPWNHKVPGGKGSYSGTVFSLGGVTFGSEKTGVFTETHVKVFYK